MHKYPKVNYIGNKEKISDWIIENLPTEVNTIVDLFAGGSSVSYALKDRGFRVFSNDVLYANYVVSKAIVENSSVTLDASKLDIDLSSYYLPSMRADIDWLTNYLYFDYEVDELTSLINYSSTLAGYEYFLFLALLRRAMIRKLPYSRMNVTWTEIVKLRDEEYSYEKYGRRRAYHNRPFLEHMRDNLDAYNHSVFDNYHENRAYRVDAETFINEMNDRVDLIYLDPPYPSTMNRYDDFYGDFGRMLGILPIEKTDFTDKTNFLENIRRIFDRSVGRATYLVMSLNSRSKPSLEEILAVVGTYLEDVKIYTTDYAYKVTGKRNKNNSKEKLLICKIKS